MTNILKIAHRGYCFNTGYPENSLLSFEMAAKVGADAIEFDVWLSKDQVPIVFHDYSLANKTDVLTKFPLIFPIAPNLTLLELKSLSISGLRIPTLWETIELCKKYNKKALIEVKSKDPVIIEKITETLVSLEFDNCIIISFNYELLKGMPFPTGALFDRKAEISEIKQTGCQFYLPRHDVLHSQDFELLNNISIIPWTVNDRFEMHNFIRLGVKGIITDRLDLLLNPI